MPSLWKKHKGSKISRLVTDLQTPSKRGGSYVVETGFPTSLVDLFQKNKEKLCKPSHKKKLRFKKILNNNNNNYNNNVHDQHIYREFDALIPVLPLVSHPSPSGPTYLDYDHKNYVGFGGDDHMRKRSVGHYQDSDIFVEEIVESSDEFCDEEENSGVYLNRNVFWLSVWVGISAVAAALYNKKIVCGVTLAILLLVLLEYVGNSVFQLFKRCENAFLLLFSKGALVGVVVGLCTRRFVVGMIISVVALVGLELAAKAVFRLLRPRDNGSRGFDGCAQGNVVEEPIEEGDGKEGLNRGVVDAPLNKEDREVGGIDVVLKRDIEDEDENSSVFRGIEQEDDEGNDTTQDWRIESENNGNISMRTDVNSIEEEARNEPIYEVEPLERSYSAWPRQPIDGDASTGLYELPRKKGKKGKKEKWDEGAFVVDENGKVKKKKFWKKLVPKHMRKKKKYKQARDLNGTSTECLADNTEFEEEDEVMLDDSGVEIADGETSYMPSSSDDEEDSESDLYVPSNRCYYSMLQIDNRSKTCRWMEKVKDGNLKCLILVAIPLVGLIRGRIFALILTVISGVVFKMFRG